MHSEYIRSRGWLHRTLGGMRFLFQDACRPQQLEFLWSRTIRLEEMTTLPPGLGSITWTQQRQRARSPLLYVRNDAGKQGPGAEEQECHGERNRGGWLSRWLSSLEERGNS